MINCIYLVYYIFIILLFPTLFVSNCFSSNDKTVGLNQQIQSAIEHDRLKYHLPALSVSILLPNEVSARNYVSGFYSRENKQKITADTLFKIGSITKTFTAMIIMKLIEENKLHLDDTMGKWFPQYPRWKQVTVMNLLNHTSGIYDYTYNDNDVWKELKNNPKKTWKMIELSDLAYRYPDYFSPGKGVKYSNTDYVLLGMIIEKITHQPVQDIFDQYFKKLNLTNTFIPTNGYSKKMLNRMAHGYDNEGTFGVDKDVTNVNLALGKTDGAMLSTPNDILVWLNQLFTAKVISKKSLDTMMTLISPKNAKLLNHKICVKKIELLKNPWTEVGLGMGMGLVYFRDYGFIWAHSGGIPGYESLFTYNPCKGIYVVLTYDVKPKKQFIFMAIADDIFKILDNSKSVEKKVNKYKNTHKLPNFCSTYHFE